MQAARDAVRGILERPPDDASLEDIQVPIYVRQEIDRALEDGEAGRKVSSAACDRRVRWLAHRGTGR